MASSTWGCDIRSMSFMWMSLVEMKVWIRHRSAPFRASAARWMSPGTTRARAAMTGPRTLEAISRTASNSPSEETGKPASMMSTSRRASCSAISTFSGLVSAIPGACSPSRRVVSKMRTTSSGIGHHLLLRLQPRHHPAKLATDVLDTGRPGLAPEPAEVREAVLGLGDPLLGEFPALDLVQDPLHLRAHLVVDHSRAPRVVAVLGRVGDRVPHPAHAALVHQVHDQLQLVEALEVRDLGLVPRAHQRLEPRPDQLGDPAAKHDLLAEQVGLGLLLEARLDHTCPGHTYPRRVRQRALEGLSGGVLVHGNQRGRPDALLIRPPEKMAGTLGRDHRDVHPVRRSDPSEVDV